VAGRQGGAGRQGAWCSGCNSLVWSHPSVIDLVRCKNFPCMRIVSPPGDAARCQQLIAVRRTVTAAKQHTTPRDKWAAAHADPLEQAVSAGRELARRNRAERRVVQVVEPTPVAVEAPPVVIETPGIALQRR